MTHPSATTSQERVTRALQNGLHYLAAQQQDHGEFSSLWADDVEMRKGIASDPSVFPTAHILCSLIGIDDPLAREMVAKSARFLESEMLPGGVWRFWTRSHPGHKSMPPDADDTACIRHALTQAGHSDALRETESSARALVLGNRDWRGRLYTWIIRRPWHRFHPAAEEGLRQIHRSPAKLAAYFSSGGARPADLDVVVNANVLLWLKDTPGTRPLSRWIGKVVRAGQEEKRDRYYQSCYPLYYALMRCSAAGVQSIESLRDLIVHRLETRQSPDGSIGDHPLETALAANVLGHWAPTSPAFPPAIANLIQTQLPDGSWPNRALYYSGWARTRTWGSPEMTTAFCLEALARCCQIPGTVHE